MEVVEVLVWSMAIIQFLVAIAFPVLLLLGMYWLFIRKEIK